MLSKTILYQLNGFSLFSLYIAIFGLINVSSKYFIGGLIFFVLSVILVNTYFILISKFSDRKTGIIKRFVKEYSYELKFKLLLHIISAIVIGLLITLENYLFFSILTALSLTLVEIILCNSNLLSILFFTPFNGLKFLYFIISNGIK
jgi:hypothetical protein